MKLEPSKTEFTLVTDADRAKQAEEKLLARFRKAAEWVKPRLLGFPGGSEENDVYWMPEAGLWFSTSWQAENRWWHAFGLGEPGEGRSTSMEVEINPPFSGVNRRVAGAYLEDAEGRLYLAHSGKVGGGREGIGKKAFLASFSGTVVVVDGYPYCLVGGLDDEDFVRDTAAFVQQVRTFKASVAVRKEAEDEDDDLGPEDILWLFQPGSFSANRREAAKTPKPGDVGTWTVTEEPEWMGAGGRVVLCRGGERPAIYAVATLTGAGIEHSSEPGAVDVRLRYDAVLSTPILAGTLEEDEVLAELGVLEADETTNFELGEDEWDRISSMFAARGASCEPHVSPEARSMIDQIEAWHPDEELRRVALDLFAGAIEAAHDVSPTGWSATAAKSGDLGLNTGRNATVGLTRGGRLGLGLAHDTTPPPTLKHAEAIGRERYDFVGPPEGTWWSFEPAAVAHELEGLTKGVLGFAERSARAYSLASTGRFHKQSLVDAVAHLVGRALPSPGYVEVDVQTEDALDFDSIVGRLVEGGFHFSRETVATYLLALQAKRFVILSGISGTGKTVLAKEVARALQGSANPDALPETGEPATAVTVKPYNLKFRRITVPASLAKANPGFVEAAEDGKRVHLEFPGGRQEVALYKPKAASTVFVHLKKEAAAWFAESVSEGDVLNLSVEPNEDGEPLIVRVALPADPGAHASVPRRYEVVAVRPDWTDQSGLLGYYNPLQQEYSSTPFLQLLLRAADEHDRAVREERPARPFFTILDEMNLARVEHYFSDFLSCMESGEPITLHDDLSAEQDGVPRRLRVPPNLFFTGTVNVDESTYMFSPKVLDRAFTLEFNDVDLDSYGADADEVESDDPMQLNRFEGRLRVKKKLEPQEWTDFRARSPELTDVLKRLNDVLAHTHRHFGYRVANEIGRFMNLVAEQATPSETTRWAALDIAIRSKALPKLHGTQQEIEPTLKELFGFAVDPSSPAEAQVQAWEVIGGALVPKGDGPAAEPRLPRTALKLYRMLRRVRAQGFTSFIE